MTAGDEGGAACSDCHSGDVFTDGEFHAIGLGQVGPGMGHSNPFVTGKAEDFRTFGPKMVPWRKESRIISI